MNRHQCQCKKAANEVGKARVEDKVGKDKADAIDKASKEGKSII